MPETMFESTAEVTQQYHEDVQVEVTEFFGNSARHDGPSMVAPACPKCLGDDDKAVTRAAAQG